MVDSLPLFPLGTVLLPGANLPLHVFEPRYRQLVVDLTTEAVDADSFGVIAIRKGWSADIHDLRELHRVGCTAVLREVRRLPDGRFDIVTTGDRRFRLLSIDHTTAPYLVGTVQWLPDTEVPTELSPALPMLANAARSAHRRYCSVAWRKQDWSEPPADTDPSVLANLLAADGLLAMRDRQRLLEEIRPERRLRLIRRMLTEEAGILRQLRAIPVSLPEFGQQASQN
ncbi:MAG: LON peptidase substrate-binding domain-containing protein [Sciscionella sp.]|nr:LON peptidase substrate-binding domain-containing protein [Sciscionella sp.]